MTCGPLSIGEAPLVPFFPCQSEAQLTVCEWWIFNCDPSLTRFCRDLTPCELVGELAKEAGDADGALVYRDSNLTFRREYVKLCKNLNEGRHHGKN